MNASLADQLKVTSLNFNDYGRLPMREDVLLFKQKEGEAPILKQWDKLRLIRKNLFVLNKYLQKNKGETVSEWLYDNKEHLSDNTIHKIGNHNNETGGISAYFFDLQNFYDHQEQEYDFAESKNTAPADAQKAINEMRLTRSTKRKARGIIRKEKLKNLKTDGKGFLLVAIEEPPIAEPVKNADGKTEAKPSEKPVTEKKETDKAVEEIRKTRKKIAIYFAGSIFLITAITLMVKYQGKE